MRCTMLVVCALLAGCGADDPTFAAAEGDAPTYHGEVAPLLARHCWSCHSDGAIAPFALDDYETARAMAPVIKQATAERTMPPWLVSDGGDCHSYENSRALADEDIALLGAWADAGAPEGEAAPAPEMPASDALDAPTLVLDPGVAYTPPEGVDDDYRCFVVDPGISTDMFLTAYEVRPDAIEQVHHVVLYSIDNEVEAQAAAALDAAEDGPGYTCFGASGTGGGRSLAVWAPGTGTTRYPEGTGLRLMGGRGLVMQVHYNRATRPDQTTIALELASSVEKEGIMTGVLDISLSLPPGQAAASGSAAWPVPPLLGEVTLHGVYPHMHKYGTKLRAFWDRGGDSECLVDVPRYDFNWQQFFFYREPVVLDPPGGGYLRVECEYDTRGAMQPITWGEGTDDEMCIAAFYATY